MTINRHGWTRMRQCATNSNLLNKAHSFSKLNVSAVFWLMYLCETIVLNSFMNLVIWCQIVKGIAHPKMIKLSSFHPMWFYSTEQKKINIFTDQWQKKYHLTIINHISLKPCNIIPIHFHQWKRAAGTLYKITPLAFHYQWLLMAFQKTFWCLDYGHMVELVDWQTHAAKFTTRFISCISLYFSMSSEVYAFSYFLSVD